jgi:myo-inositol-hexaphosphate 3-phosphohydrolase
MFRIPTVAEWVEKEGKKLLGAAEAEIQKLEAKAEAGIEADKAAAIKAGDQLLSDFETKLKGLGVTLTENAIGYLTGLKSELEGFKASNPVAASAAAAPAPAGQEATN